MTKITIREYTSLGSGAANQSAQIALEDGNQTDQAAITALPATSAAFAASTSYIEVATDTDIQYAIGASPTAGANSMMIFAGASKFIGVRPGQKIAVAVKS